MLSDSGHLSAAKANGVLRLLQDVTSPRLLMFDPVQIPSLSRYRLLPRPGD